LPSALEWLLLFPEAQTFDYVPITLNIIFLDVIEQPSPLPDEFQKTAPGMMIFLMRLEMLRQIFNSCAQKSNLYFRGPGILFVQPVVLD